MKIQAWENHQKAKTEAEMRKIEVNHRIFIIKVMLQYQLFCNLVLSNVHICIGKA